MLKAGNQMHTWQPWSRETAASRHVSRSSKPPNTPSLECLTSRHWHVGPSPCRLRSLEQSFPFGRARSSIFLRTDIRDHAKLLPHLQSWRLETGIHLHEALDAGVEPRGERIHRIMRLDVIKRSQRHPRARLKVGGVQGVVLGLVLIVECLDRRRICCVELKP